MQLWIAWVEAFVVLAVVVLGAHQGLTVAPPPQITRFAVLYTSIACFILGSFTLFLHQRFQKHRLPPGRPLAWSGGPLVLGHRGCRPTQRRHARAVDMPPENTLEAFAYALARGVEGVELDVRLTQDGVPVVFHDAYIGRCLECDRNVKVSDLTLRQLQKLQFKNVPMGSYSSGSWAQVPTLHDALALVKERGVTVLIETKDTRRVHELATKVVELIRQHDLQEDAVVISFDPRSLYHVRRIASEIRTCWLWAPGIFTVWALSSIEALPWSLRGIAPLVDLALLLTAHPALLPTFLGVSVVGPMAGLRRCGLNAAWRRGIATYVWVVNNAELRDAVVSLSEQGVWAYSTDDLWPRLLAPLGRSTTTGSS